MASVLKIKRRVTGASGAPASLAGGELAYNEVNDVLYYGKGNNGSGVATSIVAVAGSGNGGVDVSSTQTITGDKTFSGALDVTGTLKIGGTTVTSDAAELNLLDGITAGTASASKALVVDASKDLTLDGGDLTVADLSATGNVIIGGDLTVNGTTTTINSTIVAVDDKAIELGSTASPSDASANGGGIILKGTTDKTILYANGTASWDVSEHVNLASGKELKIDGTSVLSSSTLGSSIVYSDLEKVGAISEGYWEASTIGIAYGGTGQTTAQAAIDALTQVSLASQGQVLVKNASGNAAWGSPTLHDRLQALTDASAPPSFAGGMTDRVAFYTNEMGSTADFFKVTEFSRGLLGGADAAAHRSTLGLVIGTDVQAYDAELAAIAGLTSAADKGVMFSGSGTAATFDLTSFGRSLVDDANASAARSTLGVVIGTDVQAYNANLGAIAGLTSAADKGVYFTGSGAAAVYELTSFGRTLGGSADAAAARTSLGLGSIATQAANNVSISGGSISGVTLDVTVDGGSF